MKNMCAFFLIVSSILGVNSKNIDKFELNQKTETSLLTDSSEESILKIEKNAKESEMQYESFDGISETDQDEIKEHPFKIAVFGGPSYFLGTVKEGPMHDLKQGLKLGFHFRGEFDVYYSKYVGAGLKFDYFHSYNTNIFEDYCGNVNVTFGGLSLCFQGYLFSKSPDIYATVSVGSLRLEESTNISGEWKNVAGRTIGAHLDIGYEYGITSYFSLGLHSSLMLGSLRTVRDIDSRIINLDKVDYYNLNRVDLSLVFRFSF